MVFIKSCENCKNDCENGMRQNGLPHKFCGKNIVTYFCPINQGTYDVFLEEARKKYGFNGKAFDELDIKGDYGKFQDIVETLCILNKPITFTEYYTGEEYFIDIKVKYPDFDVFQVKKGRWSNSSMLGSFGNDTVVSYGDMVSISSDALTVYMSSREVYEVEASNLREDSYTRERISVLFKHLK